MLSSNNAIKRVACFLVKYCLSANTGIQAGMQKEKHNTHTYIHTYMYILYMKKKRCCCFLIFGSNISICCCQCKVLQMLLLLTIIPIAQHSSLVCCNVQLKFVSAETLVVALHTLAHMKTHAYTDNTISTILRSTIFRRTMLHSTIHFTFQR